MGHRDVPTTPLSDAQVHARAESNGFVNIAQTLVSTADEPYLVEQVLAFRDELMGEEHPFEGEPRTWPSPAVPPPIGTTGAASCVAITGPAAAALPGVLLEAHYKSPWLIGTEPPAQLTFRPVLPGDPGCERDAAD